MKNQRTVTTIPIPKETQDHVFALLAESTAPWYPCGVFSIDLGCVNDCHDPEWQTTARVERIAQTKPLSGFGGVDWRNVDPFD